MADLKHPRHFGDNLKGQIADLINTEKTKSGMMWKYGLGKGTVDRWVKAIGGLGSPHAVAKRAPE